MHADTAPAQPARDASPVHAQKHRIKAIDAALCTRPLGEGNDAKDAPKDACVPVPRRIISHWHNKERGNGAPWLFNPLPSTSSSHTLIRCHFFFSNSQAKPLPSHIHRREAMQFNAPTYRLPRLSPERRYPAGVVVEHSLRVWAISRWRGPTDLAHFFLASGYAHLPPGSPRMFRIQEQYGPGRLVIGLVAHFTNRFDAFFLLGQVFWCGCEFIAFTTYNIFTDFDSVFPTPHAMHTLPYELEDEE